MSSPAEIVPAQLYCFKCRKLQPVKANTIHKELMKIKTKSGKEHFRSSWVGVCGVCEKSVRRFAKSEKKPEEAAPVVPVAPVVEAPKSN